jgi:hypothetical protein
VTDREAYREQDLRRSVAEDDGRTERELWDEAWALIDEAGFVGPSPSFLDDLYRQASQASKVSTFCNVLVTPQFVLALLGQRVALMAEVKRLNSLLGEKNNA